MSVLLHVLLELGKDSSERAEFAPVNGLDHVLTIRSVKEEAPTSPSAVFCQHQLQLVEEGLLELVHSYGLHELFVRNPRLFPNALEDERREVSELAKLEVGAVGSVCLQDIADLEIVLGDQMTFFIADRIHCVANTLYHCGRKVPNGVVQKDLFLVLLPLHSHRPSNQGLALRGQVELLFDDVLNEHIVVEEILEQPENVLLLPALVVDGQVEHAVDLVQIQGIFLGLDLVFLIRRDDGLSHESHALLSVFLVSFPDDFVNALPPGRQTGGLERTLGLFELLVDEGVFQFLQVPLVLLDFLQDDVHVLLDLDPRSGYFRIIRKNVEQIAMLFVFLQKGVELFEVYGLVGVSLHQRENHISHLSFLTERILLPLFSLQLILFVLDQAIKTEEVFLEETRLLLLGEQIEDEPGLVLLLAVQEEVQEPYEVGEGKTAAASGVENLEHHLPNREVGLELISKL